jgi:transposase
MMNQLITGQRDAAVLARLARTGMRKKIPVLQEALTGRFTDHHAFLLSTMLRRIDGINVDIAELETQIEAVIAPFAAAVRQLDEVVGIGVTAASILISEIGVDMSRFPTAGHLASWAKFAPGVSESAGRRKGSGATGHGNRYLASVLGEIAVAIGRTDTFLGERYRRIARRRGTNRAIVAVGRSVLVVVWHLLSDPEAHFQDLGSDFYQRRRGTERQKASHIQQLQALGYRVTLEPVA